MSAPRALAVPIPTNRTVEGPRLLFEGHRLVVEYDCEQDDGASCWGRIVFEDVLSHEYRDSACCRGEDVLNAKEIRDAAHSAYLESVVGRWDIAVGWQDHQREKGGRTRFRHFTVFFDDAGCLDVVATTCIVESETAA